MLACAEKQLSFRKTHIQGHVLTPKLVYANSLLAEHVRTSNKKILLGQVNPVQRSRHLFQFTSAIFVLCKELKDVT